MSSSTSKARKGRTSRSVSKSPLASPKDELGDPIARTQSPAPAFVSFQHGSQSGIDKEARRAIRSQAAKSSAEARKRTIANKLAAKKSMTFESASPASVAASDSASSPSSASTSAPSAGTSRHGSGSGASSIRTAQMDLSRSYPTTRWHPQMPDLVEYFLTHFVPDATIAAGSDREPIRSQLWPDALRDTALFHAILLVAASHATASGAMTIPTALVSQLKRTTLESINSAIEWAGEEGRVRDSVIAAIALLGQWELVCSQKSRLETQLDANICRNTVKQQFTTPTWLVCWLLSITSAEAFPGHDLRAAKSCLLFLSISSSLQDTTQLCTQTKGHRSISLAQLLRHLPQPFPAPSLPDSKISRPGVLSYQVLCICSVDYRAWDHQVLLPTPDWQKPGKHSATGNFSNHQRAALACSKPCSKTK